MKIGELASQTGLTISRILSYQRIGFVIPDAADDLRRSRRSSDSSDDWGRIRRTETRVHRRAVRSNHVMVEGGKRSAKTDDRVTIGDLLDKRMPWPDHGGADASRRNHGIRPARHNE